MLPFLQIGNIKIPMYALMVCIGFLAYVLITIYIFEKREKLDKKITNKVLLLSVPSFVILVFFAFAFNSLFHSIEEGKIVLGGITWLGGVVGGFPCMIWLIHKFLPEGKGNALYFFKLLIPGIVLAHAFGRIGCFCGGCCFGKVTNSFLGLKFPPGSLAAQKYPGADGYSLPVLPTQLIEAVFELLLFVFLLVSHNKVKKYNTEIYLFSYGCFRFVLEFFRGDNRGSTGVILSPSQVMSIVIIIAAVCLALYQKGIIIKSFAKKMEQEREQKAAKNENSSNSIGYLKDLYQLLQEGIITEEEFIATKKGILANLTKNNNDDQI
ncbi:MAG: prolipoprotein diacylglyceryl transferase [Clostridia bacterium]|nr:prolipoprotein diacylglyceryl transferase [Clostridia bacterium]